ncbi:MAG: putative toxin-antitoxin system toxin component, PIN family [Comamonadaceae bacterium]|nr:MAG: putative toxin-antitoxin system toxin component, PIN family [Comamonadaceae bacterium]
MRLVLDTNLVLDALVFRDPATAALLQGLEDGSLEWLATTPMRDELARVLAYPKLALRVARQRGSADAVLADFDRHARIVVVPPRAPAACGDPDDQKFIDLAVAHRCPLLSKDFEVLRMKKRLAALDVAVAAACPASASASVRPAS